MGYTRAQANWQNDSAGGTPINRVALNTIEAGIVNVDGRVTTIETLPGTNKGALIVSTTGGTLSRQLIGTDGQVLTADSTQTTGMKWATPGGGGAVTSVAGRTGAVVLTPTDVSLGNVTNTAQVPASLLNAQGALASANSSGVPGKLDASANFGGEVLTYDGSQALGLKWAFPAYGVVQKAGTDFTPRTKLNFIGSGVTVVDSGGFSTDVTIAGGGSSTFSVRAATTSINGTTTSGPQTVDGVACVAGNRVLYKDSSTSTFNGIYIVQSGAWTRSTDMAAGSTVAVPTLLSVSEGAVNGGRTFQLGSTVAAATSVTIGTNPLSVTPLNVPNGYATPTANVVNGQPIYLLGTEGNYFVNITVANTIISIPDGVGNSERVVNVAVQMDAVGGKRYDFTPSSVAWDNGFTPSNDGRPSQFDLTAGVLTFMRFTWMGSANGYYGEIITSIPPLFVNPSQTLSVTNSASLGYGGVNTQNLNMNVLFMRYFPSANQQLYYNALTQCFSAANRQRMLNNNMTLEVGAQVCTDGPRGGYFRGGSEINGGFFVNTPLGYVAAVSNGANQAGASAATCHEMCHAMDALYYGGVNAHPGAGIGNGSEPDQISSHSAFQGPAGTGIYTDCVNNAGSPAPANQFEWFAEMERFRRLADNGPVGTPGTSMYIQCGNQTNAGPGGTGGTPAARLARFNTYMTSLGLV